MAGFEVTTEESFLQLPGNRAHWRRFRAAVDCAKSQKASLLVLPVEYFSVRSRRQLRQLVDRAKNLVRRPRYRGISVAFGVRLLGKKWPPTSDNFIHRSVPPFPATWSPEKGWLCLSNGQPVKGRREWEFRIQMGSEHKVSAFVTRTRTPR